MSSTRKVTNAFDGCDPGENDATDPLAVPEKGTGKRQKFRKRGGKADRGKVLRRQERRAHKQWTPDQLAEYEAAKTTTVTAPLKRQRSHSLPSEISTSKESTPKTAIEKPLGVTFNEEEVQKLVEEILPANISRSLPGNLTDSQKQKLRQRVDCMSSKEIDKFFNPPLSTTITECITVKAVEKSLELRPQPKKEESLTETKVLAEKPKSTEKERLLVDEEANSPVEISGCSFYAGNPGSGPIMSGSVKGAKVEIGRAHV